MKNAVEAWKRLELVIFDSTTLDADSLTVLREYQALKQSVEERINKIQREGEEKRRAWTAAQSAFYERAWIEGGVYMGEL